MRPMADRPARGLLAAALVFGLWLAGCGGERRPSAATVQRDQLLRSAKQALRRYNERTVTPGSYAGRTARGGPVRLRVSSSRRVRFSIGVGCRGGLRAFPNRPPRLGADGGLRYRERGRGYALLVSGRVGTQSARGSLGLRAQPARGSGCSTRVRWRAERG